MTFPVSALFFAEPMSIYVINFGYSTISGPSTYSMACEIATMSDVEDYPGPSEQPAKQGQDPRGRADEGMVKPPATSGPKKGRPRKQKQRHS
jgi:hypothetical protein